MSWLSGRHRLHRRYERKAEHFLAFAGIAAALIWYRRLETNTKPTQGLRQNGSSERID